MPASRYNLNTFTLSELKSELTLKLRFSIVGKPACAKLSEVLVNEGYGYLSVATLYRLFVKFEGIAPYQNTLNILANFIGYDCWPDFVKKIEAQNHNYSSTQKKVVTNTLIYFCIESGATEPLLSFFESIEDMDHEFKAKVALDIYDSLLKTKNPEEFFSTFIDNKFVKEYVLEIMFDPAFRIKNYEHAYKLYCNDFKKATSIATIQDYIFSQSVLFRHYFLSGNVPEASRIGKRIYSDNSIASTDLDSIFIFPNIRYRAYKIWYFQLIGHPKNNIEDYVSELLDYCRSKYKSFEIDERKIVFHCVAEVFCSVNVDIAYHLVLKTIFKDEFGTIPNFVFDKSLKKALPYFEVNGLLYYRPI
jgi:hypothetical protein